MKLWRYNPATGYWKLVRHCDDANAAQWLALFQDDEPKARFVLNRKAPK